MEYTEADSKKWQPANGTPIEESDNKWALVVTGLSPGKKYVFRVTPSNRFGSGQTSSTSTGTTIGK